MTTPEMCPCDSEAQYVHCCRRYHLGEAAPSAVALMRSRYSAYAKDFTAYVRNTWHASTRPAVVSPNPVGQTWTRLTIKKHAEVGDRATVEFVAVSKFNGRASRLHEISRFVRENGRWYYVDGDMGEGSSNNG
jgi:SEC-C motif domain protein